MPNMTNSNAMKGKLIRSAANSNGDRNSTVYTEEINPIRNKDISFARAKKLAQPVKPPSNNVPAHNNK